MGSLRAKLGVDLPKQVDERGIHSRLLVFAPVAQDPVDLLHRLGDVLAAFLYSIVSVSLVWML